MYNAKQLIIIRSHCRAFNYNNYSDITVIYFFSFEGKQNIEIYIFTTISTYSWKLFLSLHGELCRCFKIHCEKGRKNSISSSCWLIGIGLSIRPPFTWLNVGIPIRCLFLKNFSCQIGRVDYIVILIEYCHFHYLMSVNKLPSKLELHAEY